jgi:hypothetical protein
MEIVNLLAADMPLLRRNADHPLVGEWNDHRVQAALTIASNAPVGTVRGTVRSP